MKPSDSNITVFNPVEGADENTPPHPYTDLNTNLPAVITPTQASKSGPASQDTLVRAIMKDVMARRARGEVLSDDRILEEHPDLRRQLQEELEGLRMLRRAFLAAQKAGPVNDAITPLDPNQLESPIVDAPPPPDHLTPWDDPRRPLHVQGYQILAEISRGGQATVFKAIQEVTGRRVAIKVLTGGNLAGSRHRARFEREAQALALLDHPNVVGILDRGRTLDGSFFLVMPFIDGCPLDEYAAETQLADEDFPLPILRTFVKIARAVHEAHRLGIIHRDLKPSNIRVDGRGEPHLLDFGLARILDGDADRNGPDSLTILTRDNQVLGSLPWACPEQAAGGSAHVDARGDVYALGVCLYQSLTGRFPYPVTGSMTELLKHITTTPAAPLRWGTTIHFQRTAALENVLARALAKSPKHRYPSAADLADDLEALLDGRSIRPPTGLFNPAPRWVRPLLYGMLACLLAATGWTWRTHRNRAAAVVPTTLVRLPTTTNSIGMRLVRLSRGTFNMGSAANARGRGADEYFHSVRLTRDFWIGDREVTRGQFRSVMSYVPGDDTAGPDDPLPVTDVTWREANEFCDRLSAREKQIYRLPTEAEWEYACRAGTQDLPFAGSGRPSDMGWYQGVPGGSGLHTGGLKSPNQWGLFDFHGNVAEWCADCYQPHAPDSRDPHNPYADPLVGGAPDQIRVVRGGSFNSPADDCRSAARDKMHPYKSRSDLGFRVILEEDTPSSRP